MMNMFGRASHRLRRLQARLYAEANGYFWMPCPRCGAFFGGHESEGNGVECLRRPFFGHMVCCPKVSDEEDAKACARGARKGLRMTAQRTLGACATVERAGTQITKDFRPEAVAVLEGMCFTTLVAGGRRFDLSAVTENRWGGLQQNVTAPQMCKRGESIWLVAATDRLPVPDHGVVVFGQTPA